MFGEAMMVVGCHGDTTERHEVPSNFAKSYDFPVLASLGSSSYDPGYSAAKNGENTSVTLLYQPETSGE